MELYQPISKIVNDGDTIGYMLLNLDESGNSFGIPVITEVSIDYFTLYQRNYQKLVLFFKFPFRFYIFLK